VWPFVSAAFAAGVFALFPYLCFWDVNEDSFQSPPDSEELESGLGQYAMRALESWWLPASQLLTATALLFNAITSGVGSWNEYFRLFDESKLVHVTSLDFCALTALLPLFLWVDAEKRKWGPRAVGVPVLSLIPMVGPLVYLMLRPRAGQPQIKA
jgi:hypothetical protein